MEVLGVIDLRKIYGHAEVLRGVFFPTVQLPLSHATQLVRPLILGELPSDIVLHVLALLAYAFTGFYAAVILFRRRRLK
jgi:lipooligosaccharide transport system permease protein